VAECAVVSVAVGLRPARPAVRLEAEARPGGTIVHNYGHGGAGVTLSWGCAAAATDLLLRS
jgi:D-amino-acid oxidase